MSISLYIDETEGQAEELIDSLDESQVDTLRARLSGTTEDKWWSWRLEHACDVEKFVAASPSKRMQRAAFRDQYLELTLAAVQACLEAHAILKQVEQCGLFPGRSYRAMSASAARAYRLLLCAEVPLWPFEGESPFLDG